MNVGIPGFYHPKVVFGKGNPTIYEDGDVIHLFPATRESFEAVFSQNTAPVPVKPPKKSGSTKTGPIGPAAAPSAHQKRGWIGELVTQRQDEYDHDGLIFARSIEQNKPIHITTDEGASSNPGAAGWVVLIRQNKHFTTSTITRYSSKYPR
jgi:hypothetical protein